MILAWIMSLNILWLRKILLFLFDHWKGILVGIAGLIVLFWLVSFSFCDSPKETREQNEIKTGIAEDKQAIANIEEQRNETEKQVNEANANFGNVLNTDTSKRNSNFGAVKRKYCQDHPLDTKCAKTP